MPQPMLTVIKQVSEYKQRTGKNPYLPVKGDHGFTSLPSWEYVEYLEERVTKAEELAALTHNSASSKCPLCECVTVSRLVTMCSNVKCNHIEASRALTA